MNWYDIAVYLTEGIIVITSLFLTLIYFYINKKNQNFMIKSTAILMTGILIYHSMNLANKITTDILGTHSPLFKTLLIVGRVCVMLTLFYFVQNTVKRVD